MTPEQIAHVVHDANRALTYEQDIEGFESSDTWEDFDDELRERLISAVENTIAGAVASPRYSHDSWLDQRQADGWVYGPVKDEVKKTHPLLVPYDELPSYATVEDHLFLAIVRTLA